MLIAFISIIASQILIHISRIVKIGIALKVRLMLTFIKNYKKLKGEDLQYHLHIKITIIQIILIHISVLKMAQSLINLILQSFK
jgi:hypothetical protein